MKNKDAIAAEKALILQKMNKSIAENDADGFAEAFEALSNNIQENILSEVEQQREKKDASIMMGRGVAQLTSLETEYYEAVIEATRSSNPKQALSDLTVVMPKTVMDRVFEDLTKEHPLLDAINFQNTSGLIEIYLNTNTRQLATWGALNSTISKELSSGFKKVSMSMNKLSAYVPVAKAMLDLGPQWLDRYVRDILTESIYDELEAAILTGTGKNKPIGMNRQVGTGVTVTDGVYPEKAKTTVTSFDAATYGSLLSGLSTTPNGNPRAIKDLILVVSVSDYFSKVMPATTIMTPDGKYVNGVLPYPTKIIQSTALTAGNAILGLSKRYFMGVGTAKSGKIEYSDDYQFLEDERVYLTKLYGHGEPLDNGAFMYLDISGLQPAILKVKVDSTAASSTT